jgi:ribosome modulation factor
MPRRKKSESNGGENPSANKEHNAGERAKIMREAAAEIIRLKAQKASIQEQIAEQRGRIKSLDIKAIDFNVAMRLMELEAEDRDKSLDGLREAFEALGVGQQLDWVSGIDYGAGDKRGVDASAAVGAAAAAGLRAGKAGKPADNNPYPEGTPAHASWLEQWHAAQADNLKDLGQGAHSH